MFLVLCQVQKSGFWGGQNLLPLTPGQEYNLSGLYYRVTHRSKMTLLTRSIFSDKMIFDFLTFWTIFHPEQVIFGANWCKLEENWGNKNN